jgi:DNA-binding NarL/FixJ family response regulator
VSGYLTKEADWATILQAVLTVSEATVKTHINNLFAKAHADAVRYALSHLAGLRSL